MDCGSLLPLCATQPAAARTNVPKAISFNEPTLTPASRLAEESGSRLPQSMAFGLKARMARTEDPIRLRQEPLLGGVENKARTEDLTRRRQEPLLKGAEKVAGGADEPGESNHRSAIPHVRGPKGARGATGFIAHPPGRRTPPDAFRWFGSQPSPAPPANIRQASGLKARVAETLPCLLFGKPS